MTKPFAALLLVLLSASTLGAQSSPPPVVAPAETAPRRLPPSTGFSVSVGAAIGNFSAGAFSLTPRWDAPTGRNETIAFEVTMFSDLSFIGDWLFAPGITLNHESKGTFVGGGFVLPILVQHHGGSPAFLPCPKVNAGFKAGAMIISAYWITYYFLGNVLGACVGVRF